MATQLSKLWEHTEPATVDALRERDQTIQSLQLEIKKLRDELDKSQAKRERYEA